MLLYKIQGGSSNTFFYFLQNINIYIKLYAGFSVQFTNAAIGLGEKKDFFIIFHPCPKNYPELHCEVNAEVFFEVRLQNF